MPNIKISAAQIIALRSATMRENGSYELVTAKLMTVNALVRAGVVVEGTRFLTVQGVSVMHAVSHVDVIASKGHTTFVSNDVDSLAMFTLDAPETESVEIQGDEPNTWAPDFLAPGARECYFGCGVTPVAVFVDYVGRTEGVCTAHRDRVEGETHELPTTEVYSPQIVAHARKVMGKDVLTGEPLSTQDNDTQESEDMGNTETLPAVLIPGVHALDMGDFKYNRFVGIGESSAVPGSLFTFGLATAISAHPGMNGTGKVNIPCEFGDVITVRTSLGDKRYVVEDNRYSATGPRKGDPILTPYATDDVRCYVCQTHGDNSMPGKNIEGEWVCGYCVAQYRTPSNLNSHSLTFYVETENAGVKYSCEGPCGGINNRPRFAEFLCEGDDETEDAGFVETDSVDDYSIVSRLSTGAGFHTVTETVEDEPLSTVSTGTTHHSMDNNGGQWTRFEHVLSVGDIVRSTETGRALYEVYALIPGIAVVYVDPCDGREPFPMGATKLYAL